MDKITAITNGTIYGGEQMLKGKAVLIKQNQILAIVDPAEIPKDATRVDAAGNFIAPGLVDLQIYGGGGYFFADRPSAKGLRTMADALVQSGTTSFLPTLATNTMEIFGEAMEVTKAYTHPAVLGLHFEGPYLNPQKRGAHPPDCIRKPEYAEIAALLDAAAGHLRMMTIAPELVDDDSLKLLLDKGVLLSAGHSNATFAEATNGFRRGVKAVTHLFNAMSPLHHRQSGLPGATFLHERACASIIADGIHVDYQTLAVSKRLLGERLFLITDAVEESKGGIYTHVRNGDHYTLPDGTLSGSALTLLQAVANCVEHAGIALDEALRMATLYPAQLIGATAIGKIAEGYRANIIVFDKNFVMQHVFLDGIARR